MNREQRRRAGTNRMVTAPASGGAPPAVLTMLAEALDAHRAGRLDEAERGYRAVLATHPDQADALHLLGTLTAQRGQPDLALTLVRRAIARSPMWADFHSTLGNILGEQGRFDDAVESYRRALQLDPRHVATHNNLGNALRKLGRLDESKGCLERALELDAHHVGAHNNMGILCERLGHRDEAVEWYRKALAIDPSDMAAQNNLGNSLQAHGDTEEAIENLRRAVELDPANVVAINNLAVALRDAKHLEEAIVLHQRALELDGEHLTTILNLGRALREANRPTESLEVLDRALAIAPTDPNVEINVGATLRDLNRPGDAIPYLERAAAAVPDSTNAVGNLAMTYFVWGRLEDTLTAYEQALAIAPEDPALLFSYGLARLASGDPHGWDLFDHGHAAGQRHMRVIDEVPAWEGEDLTGKKVLAWREQGLGDEILYATTYHDLIAAVGPTGEVHIDCERRLADLFARSFPTAVIRPVAQNAGIDGAAAPSAAGFDVHVPAGGLLTRFRHTHADFPDSGAFLVPDPDRVAFWKARLARVAGPDELVAGISWRSRSTAGLRGRWYSDLNEWGPIFAVDGVRFVNLQYDDCSDELAAAADRFGVEVHGWDDIDLMHDLDDVAALTAALDLVIAPANAVSAMSGALGVPTWQMDLPDDYVTLGLASWTWFPSIKRFTRHHDEPWDECIARVAEALRFTRARTRLRRATD